MVASSPALRHTRTAAVVLLSGTGLVMAVGIGISAASAADAVAQDKTAISACTTTPRQTVVENGVRYGVTVRGDNIASICSTSPGQVEDPQVTAESPITSCSSLGSWFGVYDGLDGAARFTAPVNGSASTNSVTVYLKGNDAVLCLS